MISRIPKRFGAQVANQREKTDGYWEGLGSHRGITRRKVIVYDGVCQSSSSTRIKKKKKTQLGLER